MRVQYKLYIGSPRDTPFHEVNANLKTFLDQRLVQIDTRVVSLAATLYQLVTDPSRRLRCGASQNLKLSRASSFSSTSIPRPGASGTG